MMVILSVFLSVSVAIKAAFHFGDWIAVVRLGAVQGLNHSLD